MFRVFHKNRNVIGQLMVALIFVSGSAFAFTYDGFVSETEADSCCGGEPAVTTFAADSSGDFGSDIPMDVPAIGGCCGGENTPSEQSESNCFSCIDDSQNCTVCPNYKDCGLTDKRGCPSGSNCIRDDGCKGSCSEWVCDEDTQCGGNCGS